MARAPVAFLIALVAVAGAAVACSSTQAAAPSGPRELTQGSCTMLDPMQGCHQSVDQACATPESGCIRDWAIARDAFRWCTRANMRVIIDESADTGYFSVGLAGLDDETLYLYDAKTGQLVYGGYTNPSQHECIFGPPNTVFPFSCGGAEKAGSCCIDASSTGGGSVTSCADAGPRATDSGMASSDGSTG